MYRIYCDGEPLHDVRDSEYQVISPKLTLELNKTGSLEFSIPPTHPKVKEIQNLKSQIEVYDVDAAGEETLLYSGRPVTDQYTFEYLGTITCEGELSYLLDTIQRPHTYGKQSAEIGKAETNTAIFQCLIGEHNAQVEEEKQFQIGSIDIEEETIDTLSTNYETTWDFINTNFLEKYDGYLRVRHENGKRYLDYVKQYGKACAQAVRFGENLLDFSKSVKAEDIKTAIIPIGANNVTIKTATDHDGSDYVYNLDAVNLYGWIYEKVDFSDINSPDELLTKAKEQLAKDMNLAITIELNAADLHKIDVDIDAIGLGDLVPCISEYHGLLSEIGDVSTYYTVNKYEIDLENPQNTKITLGKTLSTLSEKTVSSQQSLVKNVQVIHNNITTIENTATSAESKAETAIEIAEAGGVTPITNTELDEICK